MRITEIKSRCRHGANWWVSFRLLSFTRLAWFKTHALITKIFLKWAKGVAPQTGLIRQFSSNFRETLETFETPPEVNETNVHNLPWKACERCFLQNAWSQKMIIGPKYWNKLCNLHHSQMSWTEPKLHILLVWEIEGCDVWSQQSSVILGTVGALRRTSSLNFSVRPWQVEIDGGPSWRYQVAPPASSLGGSSRCLF